MARMLSFSLMVLVAIAVGFSALWFVSGLTPKAQAAPLDVPPCEAINTADTLIVYRCTPDDGDAYLMNSNGFMMPEPY